MAKKNSKKNNKKKSKTASKDSPPIDVEAEVLEDEETKKKKKKKTAKSGNDEETAKPPGTDKDKDPKKDKDKDKDESVVVQSYGIAIHRDGPFYGTFTSRKTAKEAMLGKEGEPFELESGDVFYTGRNVRRRASHYTDVTAFLQQHVNAAGEEVGDEVDKWIKDVQPAVYNELREQLGKTIDAWCVKHKLEPQFFAVDKIEEHTVP